MILWALYFCNWVYYYLVNKFIEYQPMKLDDMHNVLVDHYKKYRSTKTKRSIQIESIVGQSLKRKQVKVQQMSPYQDFLRNQSHISVQQPPLLIRTLPRRLKVHFPGPPQPPPKLAQVTHLIEKVPDVPFKMPKQKPGYVGDWILEECRFVDRKYKRDRKNKSMVDEYGRGDRQEGRGIVGGQFERRTQFKSCVKKLIKNMREKNLCLGEIIKNKGVVKKAHNYYNSFDFFQMCRLGDAGIEGLLQKNPELAFDVDQQQMTGLHWAARQGHVNLCRILIQKYKANCNSKDYYGRTPLHLAVQNKNIECIIRIFIQGGNLNSLNKDKKSVRDVATDAYVKYLLQKLQQIKFVFKTKSATKKQQVNPEHLLKIKKQLQTQPYRQKQLLTVLKKEQLKSQLQRAIRNTLDQSSLYF